MKMFATGGSFQQIGQSSGNEAAPKVKPARPNSDVTVQPSAATGAREIGATTIPMGTQLTGEDEPKMYAKDRKTMIEDTMAEKLPSFPTFRVNFTADDGMRSAWMNKTRIEF